ncbi:phage tail fiber protein [bacterium]|nr:phage tail fiber protein [bacterium]
MANSFVRYTGNGSTTAYSISYTYRDAADLIVSVNGVATTAYSLNAAGTTLTFDSAPASSSAIEIRRKTSQTTRLTDYAAGSVLTENDLDTDSNQAFFMGQEAIDDANDVIKISSTDFQYDAGNKQIRNVANPTSNQDVATKHYLENTFLTTANKTALTTINANIANIIAVNNNATNINSAVSNSTNINLVANNIGSVNVVATDIAKVIEVANDLQEAVSEVETVADDLNEATSEIDTVAVNIANVNLVGNSINNVNALAPKVTELGLLGTSAVVTDLGILGTSANVTAMGHLGTSANVTAMGLLGTSAVVTDMGLLGTSANVTAMGLLGNSTVISNISTVSSKNTEIGLLGTSANVTAMGHLGTSANVTAMGLLGTSSVVTDMGILGTSTNVSNMSTLAGISGLSTLASNNANITAVAGKVTEIGLLGTSANVTNMATLGTSTNVSNMSTLAGITNLNNLANAHASVTSVANNLASVNAFGETYRIASSAPTTSLNSGDLYFNTSTNVLNVYGASGWQNAGSSVNGTSERFKFVASGTPTTFTGNDANGNTLAYDAGFIDVYLNGIKMVNGTDVTVTSGSSIVFASALTNGDIVEAVTFGTFSVANLNASNLTSGTVPSARVSGAYTGITQTGTLTSFASTGIDDNATSTAITINSSEQVAIGTTSHSSGANITLSGQGFGSVGADSGSIAFGSNTSYQGRIYQDNASSDFFIENTYSSGEIAFKTNSSERMRLTSTGLGIGETAPLGQLHVKSADSGVSSVNGGANELIVENSSDAGITIASGSTSFGKILFADSSNNADGQILYDQNGRSLRFSTAGAEAVRIDSSGNLLVGKTAIALATVGAELRENGQITGTRDGNASLILNRLNSDGDIAKFYKDGTVIGSIGTRGGNLYVGNGDVALKYSGTNDAVFPSTAVDGAGRDNAIDLGASGTRFKDLYLSGGAFLGGTGTANKLDDYEEGDWTPTAVDGIAGLTKVKATYTKIGRSVTVYAEVNAFTSKDGNQLRIGGLPFNPSLDGQYMQGTADSDSGSVGIARTDSTNGRIRFYRSDGTSSASRTTFIGTNLGSGLRFSLTYFT